MGKRIIFRRIKMFGNTIFHGRDQTGHFFLSFSSSLSVARTLAHSTDNTNPIDLFTLHSLYRCNYSHIKMSKSLLFRLFAVSYQTNGTHQLYYIYVRKTHLRSLFGVRLFKFRTRAEKRIYPAHPHKSSSSSA